MLSVIGWLNVISFLSVLIFETFFGLFFIYQSKKSNTRRLEIAGLLLCSVGLLYLGYAVNFFYYLITYENMLDSYAIIVIIIGFSIFLVNLIGVYFGTDLWLSKRTKTIVLIVNIVAGIILGILFLQDPGIYFYVSNISTAHEELLILTARLEALVFIVLIFIFQQFVFLGFGALYKGFQSQGVIRKKYFLLSGGLFLAVISAIIEFLLVNIIVKFVFRFVFLLTAWMWYFALREEKIKKEKPKEKEVKIEGDLFRLYETRPENITEEDVIFHKDRKICLVCKGKAEGFTFICPICDALYCQKCAQALTNLENACWACNGPIDKTKPVKSLKPKDEEIRFEIEKTKRSVKGKKI